MLRENSVALKHLSSKKVEDLLKHLEDNPVLKHPVRNCAKFFARMTSDEVFTYAREKFDLGTKVISASQITSRLSNNVLSEECFAGLTAFEKVAKDCWPLLPGSNSWVQLEVMTYEPKTVIMGRIVRLSPIGRNNITTTKRLNKITTEFNSGPSYDIDGWLISRANLSPVKLSSIENDGNALSMLLNENSDCQSGFYIYTQFGKIRIVNDYSQGGDAENSKPVPVGSLK